jgi:RNA polymerase sigma factor (TIGR02999 family)
MGSPIQETVTQLLGELADGHSSAVDRLLPLVYDEMRRLAASYLRREGADHTLQATALVHEAYLRLVDQDRAGWKDQMHFFAVAATVIRRILVDHARTRNRLKRGGEYDRLQLDTQVLRAARPGIDVLELDDLLQSFAAEDPRAARLVELRFFGGLTSAQAARSLGISTATAERDWRYARAWLMQRLAGDPGRGSDGP